jgi:putative ABC transport system substrate-binding protein
MKRREFMMVLGSAAAWPLAAHAQQPRVRKIAVLLRVAQGDPDAQRDLQNFRKGLWELGWMVGSNILIEYRYAQADPAQIQTYAAEIVGLPAEVVLASGSFAVAALRRETHTTPPSCSYGSPIRSVRALSRALLIRAATRRVSRALNSR